eukprot:TRINITY_DN13865_c0_g1_i1.p1 TRINITY_DN13865_c0_g1~~TRINITY_DN13865_c0_g1_i1.p1  ORF type:complete len:924 (+),score=108.70 TRINITY_DN13865_c0_g1_i1:109-2880(+)
MFRSILIICTLCLVPSIAAFGTNLVQNPGFETNDAMFNAASYQHWLVPPSFAMSNLEFHSGAWSVVLTGNGSSSLAARQAVTVSPASARQMRLGGWSKSANVVGFNPGFYSIYADVQYMDGTSFFGAYAPFVTGTHDWLQADAIFCPSKPVREVFLYAMFSQQNGTAWFDDLYVQQRESSGTSSSFTTCSVDSTALVAGVASGFTVTAYDVNSTRIPCGGDSVTASLTGPVSVIVAVTDLGSGTYRGTYTLSIAGNYILNVFMNGALISGASYAVTVQPGPVSVSASTVAGPLSAVANVPETMFFIPRDEFGNAIVNSALVIGATSSAATITISTGTMAVDGSFPITYKSTIAGRYSVVLSVNAQQRASPQDVLVIPGAPKPGNFIANLPRFSYTTTSNAAQLLARDEWGNRLLGTAGLPILATLTRSVNAASVPISVLDQADGSYVLRYTPVFADNHTLTITVNGELISNSPCVIPVRALALSVAHSQADGATTQAILSADNAVTLRLRDDNGYPLITERENITLSVTGPGSVSYVSGIVGNGTYLLVYTPSTVGQYAMAIQANGFHVPGSPFTMNAFTPAPVITSLVAADPLQRSSAFMQGAVLIVNFDRRTNRPAADSQYNIPATLQFSDSLGVQYSGEWVTPDGGGDQLIITSIDNSGSHVEIGALYVTVIGDLRDAAGTSLPSRSRSPVLSGNFGIQGCWPYGVWFGGLCWWKWVIIFVAIGVVVTGCAIFWVCWWIKLRRHLQNLSRLEDEEAIATLAYEQQASTIASERRKYTGPGSTSVAVADIPPMHMFLSRTNALVPHDMNQRRKSSIMRLLYQAAGLKKSSDEHVAEDHQLPSLTRRNSTQSESELSKKHKGVNFSSTPAESLDQQLDERRHSIRLERPTTSLDLDTRRVSHISNTSDLLPMQPSIFRSAHD